MTEPEDPAVPAGEAGEAEVIEEVADAARPEETVESIEAVETIEAAETVETLEAVELTVEEATEAVLDEKASLPAPAAEALTGERKSAPARGARPDLIDRREPLYRECKGYRLRLDPPDLARLRELPGSRGRTDDEIGEAFFDGQAERLASAIADDVPTPSEIRVVVDPYSRQAFLALENRIRGILSF